MEGARSAAPAILLPDLLARGVGFFGVLALGGSIFLPWFSVPGLPGEPLWCWIYRALTALFFVAACVLLPRLRRAPARGAELVLGLLIALLFFPYFVTVWSPTFAGEASWLHAQHESLTGSAGDLYLSQETKADAWRQRVDIVNRPITSEVVDLPDWTSCDLERLIDACDWFGAAPWFAIFVRKGWVLALCGSAGCLLALLRGCRLQLPVLVRRGALAGGAALLLALLPLLAAVALLRISRAAAQRGDYPAAAQFLDGAARCFPALREDGNFIAQRGLLDDARHRASPEAALYAARLLELRGFDAQAQAQYLAGLRATAPRAVHREFAKSLLSLAADTLNSGEVDAACALYSTVLADDPQNLKANYALQLVAVRRADLSQVRTLQAQMQATYRGFNTPTKQPVLALSYENAALAATLDGDPAAAWQALARARNP